MVKSRKKKYNRFNKRGGTTNSNTADDAGNEKIESRRAAEEMVELVDEFDKKNPPEPPHGSPEELEKLQVDAVPPDTTEDGPIAELTPPTGGAKIAKHPLNPEALLAAVTDKKPAEDVLPKKSGTITVDGHAAATKNKPTGFHGGKKHKRKTRKKRKTHKKRKRKRKKSRKKKSRKKSRKRKRKRR
jgi:hypothetical protein